MDKSIFLDRFIASSEGISNRRVATFLMILFANVIFLYSHARGVVSLGAILMNVSWRQLSLRYRDNNAVKFDMIGLLEKELGVSLFSGEWIELQKKHDCANIGRGEMKILAVFSFLHFTLLVILFAPLINDFIKGLL